MRIASVGTALPSHRFSQAQVAEVLLSRWQDRLPEPRLLTRLFANCGVSFRHFVFPLERYPELRGFGANNDAWIDAAVSLGETAITGALQPLGLTAADVSAFFFASVTGIASPTIDARLINRMPFPTHVKRTPIFGLGCVAGAAGIARAADYVRAFPDHIALLLSVELCSLTWQDDDLSVANLISCGLFGDGAAAVVLAGADVQLPATILPSGPRVLATRSTFYRDTEQVMGWSIGDAGFTIVLSPDVPKVVLENLRGDADAFLAENHLSLGDISSWICHSGGPRVLEAVQSALDLPKDALALSWKSLHDVGNLSATSVLMVLADTLAEYRCAPGSYSILAAMGPGFCLELVLLQW
ncbi:MAG: type III polyketide synthase [Acidobacteriota bacterium]|nr:type III polyketide synthase [Acidobacteriota bacterium]